MIDVVNKDFKILSIKNFKRPSLFEYFSIKKIIKSSYTKHLDSIAYGKNYNFPLIEHKYFSSLYEDFKKSCFNIFSDLDISKKNSSVCWCYRSTKEDYQSVFHHHEKSATINSVYYLDISKGDSISFTRNGKTFRYYPQKYELLIFPGTLLHKPDKPVSKKPRLSINLEILSNKSSLYLFKQVHELRD